MSIKTSKDNNGFPSKGHIKAINRKNERAKMPLRKAIVQILSMKELRGMFLALVSILFLGLFVFISQAMPSFAVRVSVQLIFLGIAVVLGRFAYKAFSSLSEKEKEIIESTEKDKEDNYEE